MIYVVSGQAAGGTSMMMKVMIDGGITGNYVNKASPSALKILNNPYGCFENKDVTKLDETVSKFIGFNVSAFANRPTKVIRITRNKTDIALSRIARRERGGAKISEELKLAILDRVPKFCEARDAEFQAKVAANRNIEVLYVTFENMLKDTENQVNRIAEFVAPHPFDVKKAVEAVDLSLHQPKELIDEGIV